VNPGRTSGQGTYSTYAARQNLMKGELESDKIIRNRTISNPGWADWEAFLVMKESSRLGAGRNQGREKAVQWIAIQQLHLYFKSIHRRQKCGFSGNSAQVQTLTAESHLTEARTF